MDALPTQPKKGRWTVVVCALLLVMYAVVSYSAVLTKSPTIDEPNHLVSGWVSLRLGDFRLDTVNPSLWKMYAALADWRVDLKLPPEPAIWNDRTWTLPLIEYGWTGRTLFQTPDVDGGTIINRARAMMLVLAVGLGALVGRWSYRIGGSVAAVVATLIFCLDPNFIAHGSMVKSDIAFGLDLLGLSYVTWLCGQQATWWRIISLGLICGVAGGTKYSGFIVGPILALMLGARAMLGEPWGIPGCVLKNRMTRLALAVGICIFAATCCYGITWASYGFRFGPAHSPAVRMDMQTVYDLARVTETSLDVPNPTEAMLAAYSPSLTYRFVRWADGAHLLPQPMLAGLLYQHNCVIRWQAFLNGEVYNTGRWSYFPLATLYKTPASELMLYAAGLLTLAVSIRSSRSYCWTILCIAIPAVVFSGAALQTHLNIGLRNVLPFFAFVQIGCGCAAALCWRRWRRGTVLILSLSFTVFAMETLRAWPDYLSYFNVPSGGQQGGIARLADSNLDWGQDIIGLANWQKSHSDVPLYAALFYTADPRYYGLNYHPIFIQADGSQAGQLKSDIPLRPGMLAVSATYLQGLYEKPSEQAFMRRLRQQTPIEVIGGTIYIYPLKP